MILDHFLEFTSSKGQTLTAAAASDFRFDFYQEEPTTGMDTDRRTYMKDFKPFDLSFIVPKRSLHLFFKFTEFFFVQSAFQTYPVFF